MGRWVIACTGYSAGSSKASDIGAYQSGSGSSVLRMRPRRCSGGCRGPCPSAASWNRRSGSDQSIYTLPAAEFADAHPFWSGPDDGSAATIHVTGGLFTSSAAFIGLDLDMSGFQGPVEFATTWARGDARTYETEASPAVVRSIPAGCRVHVDPGQWPPESDPPVATDVDRVVVYYAGLLGRWKRVAPWPTRNQPVPVPTISEALGSSPPPGSSSFPENIGEPGVLASATGGLALYGNGKAEVDRDPVDPVDVVNKRTLDSTKRIGRFTMPAHSGSGTLRVNFEVPFPAGVIPIVVVNFDYATATGITRTHACGGEDNAGFTVSTTRATADGAQPMKYIAVAP